MTDWEAARDLYEKLSPWWLIEVLYPDRGRTTSGDRQGRWRVDAVQWSRGLRGEQPVHRGFCVYCGDQITEWPINTQETSEAIFERMLHTHRCGVRFALTELEKTAGHWICHSDAVDGFEGGIGRVIASYPIQNETAARAWLEALHRQLVFFEHSPEAEHARPELMIDIEGWLHPSSDERYGA